jgi:hypothetical protein
MHLSDNSSADAGSPLAKANKHFHMPLRFNGYTRDRHQSTDRLGRPTKKGEEGWAAGEGWAAKGVDATDNRG